MSGLADLAGYVQDYPCDCSNHDGMCFIVRHPAVKPPISYESRERAERVLTAVRAGVPVDIALEAP